MNRKSIIQPELFKRTGRLLAVSLLAACTASAGLLTGCRNTASDSPETTAGLTGQAPAGPSAVPGEHLTAGEDGSYRLISPDGNLWLTVTVGEEMGYSVSRLTSDADGEAVDWVRPSKLGVKIGRTVYYQNAEVTDVQLSEINRSFALMGNQSSVDDHCFEAVFTLRQGDYTYYLDARAYNNGVAFRYRLPGEDSSSRTLSEELTTYQLRTDLSKAWYGVNNQDYESVISSYSPTRASDDLITAPLTAVVKNDGGYIAIMEGALTDSYSGVNLKALGKCAYGTAFYTNPSSVKGDMVSGWRLINIADSLNDLVNNYNVYCVNEAPDEALFADIGWIEPGRSTWSWCVSHGAPTPEQMREYILAAAKLGYEYNIIDDGWPSWGNYKTALTALGEMGEALNVKQLLWGAITAGTSGYNKTPDEASVDRYMKLLEETHMYGAKVDFWWSEANVQTTALQKYILEEAAKRQFVIDFHGCNKNSGFNVTYPNELSREGVRGLENIGSSNTTNYQTYAEWLNAQLYTRFLCGHADWTPATYTVMEIASIICIDSPLMVVASDPADLLDCPAVEFVKSIPTVWDRTVVLSDSKLGSYSVYAKEKEGVWFVGGIASSVQRSAKVELSEFLDGEGDYYAEIWTEKNGEMICETQTVTKDGTVEIGNLNAGQGFVLRLSKLTLSQYGGEISGPIAVSAPAGAVVKYTVDGSDPRTSSTAAVCDGSIILTGSCRLKVAVTEGDGKDTLLSYQFNQIGLAYTFSPEVIYGNGSTEVILDLQGADAKIYYTLDGSVPTEASPEAGASLTLTESAELNYLVVSADGTDFAGRLTVNVRSDIVSITPDLPLTDEKPISASASWGNVHYDTSMATDNEMAERPIMLGGTNLEDGTVFERGISSNSTSVYRWNVPEGISRFVGVAGIDDCVYNNQTDRSKASARCVISFDGAVVYTSEVLRMGGYTLIDIEVPAGAAVIEIRFDDAGDGATCDNVSLGNPGWIK